MRERERGRKSGFAKCEKRQMRGKNKKEGIEKRVEPRKTRLRMSGCGRGRKNCGAEIGRERNDERGGEGGENEAEVENERERKKRETEARGQSERINSITKRKIKGSARGT